VLYDIGKNKSVSDYIRFCIASIFINRWIHSCDPFLIFHLVYTVDDGLGGRGQTMQSGCLWLLWAP